MTPLIFCFAILANFSEFSWFFVSFMFFAIFLMTHALRFHRVTSQQHLLSTVLLLSVPVCSEHLLPATP